MQDVLCCDHRTARAQFVQQFVNGAVFGVDDDSVGEMFSKPSCTVRDERQRTVFQTTDDPLRDGVAQAVFARDIEIGTPTFQVIIRSFIDRILVKVEHRGARVDGNCVQDK